MHENHFFNSKFIRNNFDIYCLKQSHICHRPYLQFKFCVCERVFFLPMLLGHFLTDCNLVKPLYGHSFNLWLFRSLFIVLFRVFFSLFKVVILKKKRELFPIRLVETALFFASICFLNDFFLLAIYCLWAKPSSCCFLLQFRNFCIGPKNSWTTTTKPKSPTKTENGTKLKREVLVFIRIFAIRSTSLNWI